MSKIIKQIFIFISLIISFSLSKEKIYQNKIGLKINEISTNNKNILKDSYGDYSSWIEIYNSEKCSIVISGYGISNEEYIPLNGHFLGIL